MMQVKINMDYEIQPYNIRQGSLPPDSTTSSLYDMVLRHIYTSMAVTVNNIAILAVSILSTIHTVTIHTATVTYSSNPFNTILVLISRHVS